MAYTAPTTRATSDLITATIWNTDLVNNISFLANPPAVRVRKSAGQTITTSTDTPITWDTEDWDWTTAMHSTVSNTSRLIAPIAGKYRFTFQPDWDGNTAGARAAFVVKNNAGASPVALGAIRLASCEVLGTNVGPPPITGALSLAANDYIEAYVYQDSGGNRTFGAAQRVTASFSLEWFSL